VVTGFKRFAIPMLINKTPKQKKRKKKKKNELKKEEINPPF
jgi:hypothetical protein